VLLEPDAEEVRQEERRRARQQTTIFWFKVILATMILIGLAGAVVVWNRRETLRIAADLENARSAGAKSFDELGTCNAAHTSDIKAIADCRAEQDKATAEHKQQLEEVMHTGSASEAERAREAQKWNSRFKTCEDNATTAKRVSDDEIARILLDTANEKAALRSQRDEAKKSAEDARAEMASLTAEREQCRAERLVCAEERDACKAAAKAAPPGPRSPPSPGGSASPAPGGSSTPVAPPEPVAPADPKPAPLPSSDPKPAPAPQQQPAQVPEERSRGGGV
jgi:septal ring factor EnvC (AmiA/AmiB activator)